MNESFENRRRRVQEAQAELARATDALQTAERFCQHQWGPAAYTPIVSEAHTIPGDPPGTMGVDWRGPTYVPSSSRPCWTRVCLTCGKEEKTFRSHTPPGQAVPSF